MSKILFVMFQGAFDNLTAWNKDTKSKFLDRLKTLGSVYTYQDKINNIRHYNLTDPEHNDFDDDIDFGLSYITVNNHIKLVYDDIQRKYKNLANYKFIPIGHSIGGLFALYFCQKYASQCLHCILLDPTLWTPKNMKLRLEFLKSKGGYVKITNIKFKKMLQDWKDFHTNVEDMYLINTINHMIRSSYFSKHLKLKLSVPTTSFVNIENPEKKPVPKDVNNKNKLNEIKILEKYNPDKYKAILFINKTHYIFYDIQPAKKIIKYITTIINDYKYHNL